MANGNGKSNGKKTVIRRPSRVKIGARVYRIAWDQEAWDNRQQNDDYDTWAQCNHEQLTIVIKPQLAEYNKRTSLLHEILHCLFHASGADIRNVASKDMEHMDFEEYIICRMEEPLMSVLTDNPELLAYVVIGEHN